MHRKNIEHVGFGIIRGFRHPLGFLDCSPLGNEGLLCVIFAETVSIHP